MPRAGEFALIDAIVAQLSGTSAAATPAQVVLGPGDDTALVQVPQGMLLATSVDTLLPDVHFPATADPELVGYRALAVNASDLAAMGARPLAAVVALVLPAEQSADWAIALARGLAAAAADFHLPVTGGNLAAGPLSLSITVQGVVPAGEALLRSGAQPGDAVYVSGALGGAALALQQAGLATLLPSTLGAGSAAYRYYKPQPRLQLGERLRGVASAAIDVSDGLAADLLHVATASGVDVRLTGALVPRFASANGSRAKGQAPVEQATVEQALTGGDDYELAFTVPVEREAALPYGLCELTRIGECVAVAGSAPAVWLDGEALDASAMALGYDHFARG